MPNLCENGGECVANAGFNFTCVCPPERKDGMMTIEIFGNYCERKYFNLSLMLY